MSGRSASDWKFVKSDYRNKVAALEENYPDLLKKHPVLQAAVLQAKVAEAAIEGIMASLADAEYDDDDGFN